MKFIPFKNIFFLAIICLITSCNIDEIGNANGPDLAATEENATIGDLRLLAHGLQADLRTDMEYYYWTVSMIGREYYDLRGIDPRFTGELLGKLGAVLDNNGFLTTRAYAAHYKAVKDANVLISAAEKSVDPIVDGDTENAILGFAKTWKAYALLLAANRQYDNGIRIDVADPDNLGKFTANYQESLSEIAALFDEANRHLTDAPGATFPFNNTGTADIYNPEPDDERDGINTDELSLLNRALAARVAMYQNDKAAVKANLEASFMDLNGDLSKGVFHEFGAGGNDQLNALFYDPGVELYMVDSTFLEDIDFIFIPDTIGGGEYIYDSRIGKVTTLESTEELQVPVFSDGLSSETQVTIFSSDRESFPIINNEELLLLYAEAHIGSDNNAAVEIINQIRNEYGMNDFDGDVNDDEAMVTELLHQRRYSLFGLGHRWIDMRRYDRLDELPLLRDGDKVHLQFPRPADEGQ